MCKYLESEKYIFISNDLGKVHCMLSLIWLTTNIDSCPSGHLMFSCCEVILQHQTNAKPVWAGCRAPPGRGRYCPTPAMTDGWDQCNAVLCQPCWEITRSSCWRIKQKRFSYRQKSLNIVSYLQEAFAFTSLEQHFCFPSASLHTFPKYDI